MNYVFLEMMNPEGGVATTEPIFVQNLVEILWQRIAPTDAPYKAMPVA